MLKDLFRPVLSDRTIMKYNKKGILIKDPIPSVQLQPNSVDLTLAGSWKLIRTNSSFKGTSVIDPKMEIMYKEGNFHDGKKGTSFEGTRYFVIQPGEFVLLASRETLNIPNGILSFVQGRSSIARLAIQTEQAGLIDSGFKGTITFEVYNQSKYPIILYEGMRIAQVYFFKSQYADTIYGSYLKGKYSGQVEATGSKINHDFMLDKEA